MRRPLVWLIAVCLFVSGGAVLAQSTPSIITFSGSTQYGLTFNGTSFDAVQCTGPSQWGSADYNRRGDFDGDGKLDVVSINTSTHWIYIRSTSGRTDNCTNDSAQYSPTSWGGSGYTWVADFNGDGKADIASADGIHIRMKLSNSGSTLTSETWTPGGSWSAAANTVVGDFNGDGKADIASVNGTSVYMKLSQPSGGMLAATWTNNGSWGGASYLRVGDFDGDGKDDIASPSGSTVHLKLSRSGYFTSQSWNAPISWGGADYTFAADFNNDGKTDIASASGGTIHMLQSQGSYFSYGYGVESYVENNWGGAGYVWVIDHDNDGDKDIVTANGSSLNVKKNLGSGNFVDESSTVSVTWGSAAYTFALDRP